MHLQFSCLSSSQLTWLNLCIFVIIIITLFIFTIIALWMLLQNPSLGHFWKLLWYVLLRFAWMDTSEGGGVVYRLVVPQTRSNLVWCLLALIFVCPTAAAQWTLFHRIWYTRIQYKFWWSEKNHRSLVSVRQNLSASYNVTIAIIRFFITFLGSLFSGIHNSPEKPKLAMFFSLYCITHSVCPYMEIDKGYNCFPENHKF